MTVRELIEALQKHDPDAVVYVKGEIGWDYGSLYAEAVELTDIDKLSGNTVQLS